MIEASTSRMFLTVYYTGMVHVLGGFFFHNKETYIQKEFMKTNKEKGMVEGRGREGGRKG